MYPSRQPRRAPTSRRLQERRKKRKHPPTHRCHLVPGGCPQREAEGAGGAQQRQGAAAHEDRSPHPQRRRETRLFQAEAASVLCARIRAPCSLNTLWFLCSEIFFFFLHIHFFFFLQPRADNTTRYHVTSNPFLAVYPSSDGSLLSSHLLLWISLIATTTRGKDTIVAFIICILLLLIEVWSIGVPKQGNNKMKNPENADFSSRWAQQTWSLVLIRNKEGIILIPDINFNSRAPGRLKATICV